MFRANLAMTLLFTLTSTFAYVSDRMDFGDVDFGKSTTFVTHQIILERFENGEYMQAG